MSASERDRRLLRAWLAGRDVPCPECGYCLRDLVRPFCPECGCRLRLGVLAGGVRTWFWPAAIGVLAAVVTFTGLVLILARTWIRVGQWSATHWELALTAANFCTAGGYLGVCGAYCGRRPRVRRDVDDDESASQ